MRIQACGSFEDASASYFYCTNASVEKERRNYIMSSTTEYYREMRRCLAVGVYVTSRTRNENVHVWIERVDRALDVFRRLIVDS